MVKDELPRAGSSVLLRDVYVQGGCALVWAATPFLVQGDWLRWTETGLVAVPLIQVAATDFRTRYVYSVVAAVGAVLGLAFGWQIHNTAVPSWTRIGGVDLPWLMSVAGALGGFVAFLLLWLLGRLIYRGREAMARGDITIAAMVGAGAAGCTPFALFFGVLFGAVIAVGFLLIGRSRHATMPYGPGLCLGGLAALFWC